MSNGETHAMGGPRPFPETSWSLIRQCREEQTAQQREGLDRLFRRYWGPVYFYIRRNWSRPVDEAKDLTQGFFAALIEKGFVDSFDHEKGRFRTFVCTALEHWLCNQRRAEQAARRRPQQGALLSFDALQLGEQRFDLPDSRAGGPEDEFAADWKRAVIDAALERMRVRAAGTAREPLVELFVRYDVDRLPDEKLRYEDLARASGLTVYQVTTGLHWARRTFREAFLDELRDQTSSEEELRAEALALFGVQL